MVKQINVLQDGDDLIIRIPNGAADNGIMSLLAQVTGSEYVPPVEHLADAPPISAPAYDHQIFHEGKYAGMTPLDVLKKDGVIKLMELNVLAAKVKRGGDNTLYDQIISDIKEYMSEILKRGYSCGEKDRTELETILRNNQKIFNGYIEQICQSKGVSTLDDLLSTLDDKQLKGAVTCCVEAFAKKVTE